MANCSYCCLQPIENAHANAHRMMEQVFAANQHIDSLPKMWCRFEQIFKQANPRDSVRASILSLADTWRAVAAAEGGAISHASGLR